MRKWVIFLLCLSQSAYALQLVGQTELKVLLWSVYRAALYSESGRYSENTYPLVLNLEYQRDIEAKKLLETTNEEWQRLGVCASHPCQQWLEELALIWPNIEKGDTLQFSALSRDEGKFYFNQQNIGSVKAANFAEQFLSIWLSEESRYPKNRAQLVGEE